MGRVYPDDGPLRSPSNDDILTVTARIVKGARSLLLLTSFMLFVSAFVTASVLGPDLDLGSISQVQTCLALEYLHQVVNLSMINNTLILIAFSL